MKKYPILLLFITISLLSFAQAVVMDATRQASDTALGSEEKAEEEVKKNTLEQIQKISKKTQEVMDSVNIYMNTATDYVKTAKQLYQAGEALYYAVENYEMYVDFIKNSIYLTPEDKLYYTNMMYNKILTIKELVNKIKDISGANSDGLDKKSKEAKEGKMKDGERLKLMTKYLSMIVMEITDINSIYQRAIINDRGINNNNTISEYSINSLFFNF